MASRLPPRPPYPVTPPTAPRRTGRPVPPPPPSYPPNTDLWSCEGPLLTDAPDSLIQTFEQFRATIIAPRRPNDQVVRLDLRQCPDIDVGALLLLIYTGQQLRRRGQSPRAVAQKQVHTILKENLEHYLLPKEQRPQLDTKSGRYLLRNVDSAPDMVSELEEWAESVRQGTPATAEQVALWTTQVAEVVTNGFQHGHMTADGPRILIAGTSRKDDKTKRHIVQLAALDFGLGIPHVIRQGLRPRVRGDGALIAFACERGVTTRCDKSNQGAGLPSLVEAVQGQSGSLLIFSNNGIYHVNGQHSETRSLESQNLELLTGNFVRLDGTLTVITLTI